MIWREKARRDLEEGYNRNTRELQRQLDAQRTEFATLSEQHRKAKVELLELRRLRSRWLGSSVPFLDPQPPPDSEFEGESLWSTVHAVGAFLSAICGGRA